MTLTVQKVNMRKEFTKKKKYISSANSGGMVLL